MKETCVGAYRVRLWKCAIEMFFSVACRLAFARATVHSEFIYLIFIKLLSFSVIYFSPQSFFLCLSLTLSLSFCHNSKYPVGQRCRLLVLVYLALGSIPLQAEVSHSSQSHKMWLVLTTALQGDRLIGLIASDRLGWTLQEDSSKSMLWIHPLLFCPFFLYGSLFAYFLLWTLSVSFSLPLSIVLPLSSYLSVFRLSIFFISHFCWLHICAWRARMHTNCKPSVKTKMPIFSVLPVFICQS